MGKKWMKGAVKPGREGVFGQKAKAAGMGTMAFAHKVMMPGSEADTKTKREANLAKTFAKYRPKGD